MFWKNVVVQYASNTIHNCMKNATFYSNYKNFLNIHFQPYQPIILPPNQPHKLDFTELKKSQISKVISYISHIEIYSTSALIMWSVSNRRVNNSKALPSVFDLNLLVVESRQYKQYPQKHILRHFQPSIGTFQLNAHIRLPFSFAISVQTVTQANRTATIPFDWTRNSMLNRW